MKPQEKKLLITLFILWLLFWGSYFSFSQVNYYSRDDGNWETNATWSLAGFGGTPAGSFPQAVDFVHIKGNQVDVKNISVSCARVTIYGSGANDAKLEIYDNYLLSISGNLTLKDDNGNKKAHLHLKNKNTPNGGRLSVSGNVYAYHTGGNKEIEFKLEDNSVMTVAGNVTLDYDNGDKNIDLDLKNNAQLNISGNLILDFSDGDDKIETNLSDNSLLDINGNIKYLSTEEKKCEMHFKNNSVLKLSGDIQRGNAATGSNFGILDFKNNSSFIYDGNLFQHFAESEGAGQDYIHYNNVTFQNTSPVSPQLQMENNEGGGATINGTINFVDGLLLLGSQDLILSGNATVTGGSVEGYVDVTTSNGGVFKKLINGNFNIVFPVGDNNDYSPFTIKTNSVNGGNFISVSVTDEIHPKLNLAGNYITRFWRINSSGFNSINYDVSYNYVDADIFGSENSLFSSKWNGSSWSSYNMTDEPANRLSTSAGITEIPFNHDFSSGNGVALPIELIQYTAVPKSQGVLIGWTLLDDYQTEYFTLEKGTDPSELQNCYRLNAETFNPMGNSYTYLDSRPLKGISYYRLNQIFKDGNTKILGIKAVFVDPTDLDIINIFPNPVVGVSYLNIYSSVNRWVTVGVLTNTLTEVKEISIQLNKGENLTEIDLNDLGPGVYFFKIKDSISSTQLAMSKIVRLLK